MLSAASCEGAKLCEMFGGERVVDVGEDESAVVLKDMREEGFGIARGDVG